MKVGDEVGAGRIPPGGPPWKGILLDVGDPRAWKGSIAFPVPQNADVNWLPGKEEVERHVAKCQARGDNVYSSLPVLWDFGTSEQRVYWERPESLRPYANEYAEWVAKNACHKG